MTDKLLDNIILGDNIKAKTEFNAIMQQKTMQSIDDVKKRLSQNIFNPQQAKVVEEGFNQYDLIDKITSALHGQNVEIYLNTGEALNIDENTANIILNYTKLLEPTEQQTFFEDMINNERTFFKSLEMASYKLEELNA